MKSHSFPRSSSSRKMIYSNPPPPEFKRGFNFWMVYVSNLAVDMLSALDLVRIHPMHAVKDLNLRSCSSC